MTLGIDVVAFSDEDATIEEVPLSVSVILIDREEVLLGGEYIALVDLLSYLGIPRVLRGRIRVAVIAVGIISIRAIGAAICSVITLGTSVADLVIGGIDLFHLFIGEFCHIGV